MHALIATDDPHTSALARDIFQVAKIQAAIANLPVKALKALAAQRFDAVFVDYDLENAIEVLGTLRRGRSNSSAIAFAAAQEQLHIPDLYQAGANFVLHKPLHEDRVLRCVRAAHGLIFQERRRYHRHELDSSVHLVVNERDEVHATAVNISEGGIGVTIVHKLRKPLAGSTQVRFALPESDVPIQGGAEIMWHRETTAGLKFTRLQPASRRELHAWLNRQIEKTPAYVSAASGARALAATRGV